MNEEKICLASDNFTSAHSFIIKAITEVNEGYSPAYGLDRWTAQAEEETKKHLKARQRLRFLLFLTDTFKMFLSRHNTPPCLNSFFKAKPYYYRATKNSKLFLKNLMPYKIPIENSSTQRDVHNCRCLPAKRAFFKNLSSSLAIPRNITRLRCINVELILIQFLHDRRDEF